MMLTEIDGNGDCVSIIVLVFFIYLLEKVWVLAVLHLPIHE